MATKTSTADWIEELKGISVLELSERIKALEVLHGQLVGLTASPLTGLARGLSSMISGLAIALGQIAEQGLVTGEEPQAPAEEPAAEEPTEEPAAEEPTEAPAETEEQTSEISEETSEEEEQ